MLQILALLGVIFLHLFHFLLDSFKLKLVKISFLMGFTVFFFQLLGVDLQEFEVAKDCLVDEVAILEHCLLRAHGVLHLGAQTSVVVAQSHHCLAEIDRL